MIITFFRMFKEGYRGVARRAREKVVVIMTVVTKLSSMLNRADMETLGRVTFPIGIEKPYLLHHGTIQPRKNSSG